MLAPNDLTTLPKLLSRNAMNYFKYNLCHREDRIRTCDPLVPNQVLYQAELLPDIKICRLHHQAKLESDTNRHLLT